METIRCIKRYLANLEWTERPQRTCRFCSRDALHNVAYEDDEVLVVENIRSAGSKHWLVIPVRHIRDIEVLTAADMPTLKAMDKAKTDIIAALPAHTPVLCGYHRGRRRLVGRVFWPDIISIHHLHLHVIIEPKMTAKLFKYPRWLPLMWKSDKEVLKGTPRRV